MPRLLFLRWPLGIADAAVVATAVGDIVARKTSMDAAQWAAAGVWATFGVAAVAAVYAALQTRLAAADRRERQRPAIVVHFVTRRGEKGAVYLRIENLGQTTARNVQVRLEPALTHDDRLEQLLARLLSRPIGTLPAGASIESLFTHLPVREKDRPRVYSARVECEDYRYRTQPVETFLLDLELLAPVVHIGRKTEHDVAEGIERLTRVLERVADHRGMRVITQTAEELERQEREDYERAMAEIEDAKQRRHELGIERPDLDAFSNLERPPT